MPSLNKKVHFRIHRELEIARKIQVLEDTICKIERPPYHFDGHTLEWGKDLSPETIKALKEDAEVFVLLDADGKPHSMLLANAYGEFKQKQLWTRRK